MYQCVISLEDEPKKIRQVKKLFDSEKHFKSDRASFTFVLNEKALVFRIKAKDAVALRATANTVMKNLAIFEKVEEVSKNG